MKTKVCTKCGKEKDASEYHNDVQKKDGKRPICKKCTLTQQYKQRAENKEEYDKRRREWYQVNKKKIAEKLKERREKYGDLIREKEKNKRDERIDAARKIQRDYYKKNKEKVKRWNEKSRKKRWEKVKQNCNKNKSRYRESLADYYVKDQIRKNAGYGVEIPDELVEVKRAIIAAKRLLKEMAV